MPCGGAVAQLGARLDGIEEVVGSNPIGSTKPIAERVAEEGAMIVSVSRIYTSMPWQEISGYHPRNIQQFQTGEFEVVEGLLVDDGPKPPSAARKEAKPFRFYIPQGADFDSLAYRVSQLVDTNQNLMNVLLRRVVQT